MVKLRMNQAILVATLAVVLLAASPASAQRTTAELRGTVTDATGGVLPGAVVAVKGRKNGATRSLMEPASIASPTCQLGPTR